MKSEDCGHDGNETRQQRRLAAHEKQASSLSDLAVLWLSMPLFGVWTLGCRPTWARSHGVFEP